MLTLGDFTWGKGLPAGLREVELINRIRMKRDWDKLLPPMDTPANIKIRSELVTALEAEEWAFRDAVKYLFLVCLSSVLTILDCYYLEEFISKFIS